MCVCIWKPKGITIPKYMLERGHDKNSHGGGFAWTDGTKITMQKGFFKFADFWEAYEPIQEHAALIHFRIRTHGGTTVANCHPFMIDDDHALVHNGIIRIVTNHRTDDSDTAVFVDEVLRPIFALNKDVYKTGAFKFLVQEALGSFNKIAILNREGEVMIFSEDSGTWRDKCWYSNWDCFSSTYSTTKSGYGYCGTGDYVGNQTWNPSEDDWEKVTSQNGSVVWRRKKSKGKKRGSRQDRIGIDEEIPIRPPVVTESTPSWYDLLNLELQTRIEALRLQGLTWDEIEKAMEFEEETLVNDIAPDTTKE